jgi:diphthine synthase
MTPASISVEALEILKQADKIYLENYTVNFPYPKSELERTYNIKIQELDRQNVEDESILEEAKDARIALLVYGDSLSATTHMQLILECKKLGIPYQVFHNASILTTIAETGLSLYKFGKTTSMPNWAEHTNKPTSFANYIKQNQSIDAHTLILTDIGLEISPAIEQLEESAKKEDLKLPEKIIAISHAGTPQQKIFYDTPENLANQHTNAPSTNTPRMQSIRMPFCLIIPNNLHFLEEESLEELKE